MSSEAAQLILADHQLLFRQALAQLLGEHGWSLAAQVATSDELELALRTSTANLVLIDRWLPGLDVLSFCRTVTSERPELRILILTAYEAEAVALQFEAFQAGAAGCLSKLHTATTYLAAIHLLAQGLMIFQHTAMSVALGRTIPAGPLLVPARIEAPGDRFRNLTPREHEILKLMSLGMNNPDIADRLSITDYTVMKHVSHIMGKLRVRNRTEATALYLRSRPETSADSEPSE